MSAHEPKDYISQSLEDPALRKAFEREWLADDIVMQIEVKMHEKDFTKQDLAKRLGCSAPNVTQLLRKGSNLTLGKMVDLALALDHRFLPPQLVAITSPDDVPWYVDHSRQGCISIYQSNESTSASALAEVGAHYIVNVSAPPSSQRVMVPRCLDGGADGSTDVAA